MLHFLVFLCCLNFSRVFLHCPELPPRSQKEDQAPLGGIGVKGRSPKQCGRGHVWPGFLEVAAADNPRASCFRVAPLSSCQGLDARAPRQCQQHWQGPTSPAWEQTESLTGRKPPGPTHLPPKHRHKGGAPGFPPPHAVRWQGRDPWGLTAAGPGRRLSPTQEMPFAVLGHHQLGDDPERQAWCPGTRMPWVGHAGDKPGKPALSGRDKRLTRMEMPKGQRRAQAQS